jgi:hypothetical protein
MQEEPMNNIAIANASAEPSFLWHRLRAAFVYVGHRVTHPSLGKGADHIDTRLLRDMGVTPDVHGCHEPRAATPKPATPRPGRPICRWRMDRSGAGLTMDWIDPKGEIVDFVRPEAAVPSRQEPARASFG